MSNVDTVNGAGSDPLSEIVGEVLAQYPPKEQAKPMDEFRMGQAVLGALVRVPPVLLVAGQQTLAAALAPFVNAAADAVYADGAASLGFPDGDHFFKLVLLGLGIGFTVNGLFGLRGLPLTEGVVEYAGNNDHQAKKDLRSYWTTFVKRGVIGLGLRFKKENPQIVYGGDITKGHVMGWATEIGLAAGVITAIGAVLGHGFNTAFFMSGMLLGSITSGTTTLIALNISDQAKANAARQAVYLAQYSMAPLAGAKAVPQWLGLLIQAGIAGTIFTYVRAHLKPPKQESTAKNGWVAWLGAKLREARVGLQLLMEDGSREEALRIRDALEEKHFQRKPAFIQRKASRKSMAVHKADDGLGRFPFMTTSLGSAGPLMASLALSVTK